MQPFLLAIVVFAITRMSLAFSGPIPEMKPQPASSLWPGLLVLSVLC